MAQRSTRKHDSKFSPTKPKKASSSPSKCFPPAPAPFTQAFYANVMATDLAAFSTVERDCVAASIWHLAHDRKPGTIKLRLYNPSPVTDGWTVDHSVLEVVNDDMPFLVDSLMGMLNRRGLSVHLLIHPVLHVRRDASGALTAIEQSTKAPDNAPSSDMRPESFMHVEFDHILDSAVLQEIEAEIRKMFDDVRAAVEDWPMLRQRMVETIDQLVGSKSPEGTGENIEEARAFMRWLDDDNFTYLGYRDIDLFQENGKLISIKVIGDSGLGILRDKDVRMFGGLRDFNAQQTKTLQAYVRQHHLIVVTKTNVISRVHRPVQMDAIFVRRYNKEGNIIGERLFVGLFTSQSYSQSPREIPFLRRKIEQVIARAGLDARSHDGKSLVHILNNYPHDELFQISEEELYQNAVGILQLGERARVALFVRRDPFGRFATCLIYVPRDHYDSSIRFKFQVALETAFGGRTEDWNVRIDDSLLARVFVTIQQTPASPQPDIAKLEGELRDIARRWSDRLRDSLAKVYGEATALALLRRYGSAFSASYCDNVEPQQAVHDIQNLERIKATGNDLVVDLAERDSDGFLHLKLLHAETPIALSEILPLIENTGLKVVYMGGPYEVAPRDSDKIVYIHEFVARTAYEQMGDPHQIEANFEEAFSKIWSGEVENDPFNALSLRAGMSWHEIRVLRTFARYLRQLRIPYTHEMMAQTFVNHPRVAQQIYALFFVRHNPAFKGNRTQKCAEIEAVVNEELGNISVLEEDRIIRRYLNLVQASLRTNFFQKDKDGNPKSYVSIKFDSRAVEFMPLPKPLFEIFVYSPRVEAVHLRGGRVARGGIRWSDRRDDFRNEILGLMKAQMVKNSVIVPVGSKGGFIVKRPPAEADKFQAEGIACYRLMMCGLLDITDNRVNNKIVPPKDVVCHDQDDPYLVVAADKGTAKFSDIANGISQEYKFWLDDAFASGGSAGYDHKGMAITARGAWEAVKRHFREMGKDIQATDFTVVGVGDMSGDVFGNGMLLSQHIRLLAAFDHRHIFCDPNPEAAVSFSERQRLYDLPHSSWANYNAKLISKGGGIFARNEKSIKISAEMKKAFGIAADSLAPPEFIQALLKSEVELLYFGGIRTYIKASDESHEDIGDRATEALRIDGTDIRAKVIGEGANLGVTQRGRIEYALRGGRINTDAIDNSAGVDTSDHEVNIKILLRKIVDKGDMSLDSRNKLLSSMTNDVAKLVLRDNYLQTQALTISEARAVEHMPLHIRTMYLLEKSGLLNRAVEFLPDASEIAERQRIGKGLTRPELAVIMAYAKIWLYSQLLDSDLTDDTYMQEDLASYFPEILQKKFAKDITQHQLGREIIATSVTNSVVNRAGTNFILNMTDQTGKDAATVTRAYLLARETFGLRDLWQQIEKLDNAIPAKTQADMHIIMRNVLGQAVTWLLGETEMPQKLAPAIQIYSNGIGRLENWLEKNPAAIGGRFMKLEADLVAQGTPAAMARRIAHLPLLSTALDITQLSLKSGMSIEAVAEVFFGLSHRLNLDWLIDQARSISAQTPWQREAIAGQVAELVTILRKLTTGVAGKTKGAKNKTSAKDKLALWVSRNIRMLERFDAQIMEWRTAGTLDLAMLTLASRQLNTLLL